MPPARKRLVDVASLSRVLPKGTEGGKEFARIVDLLLIYDARRSGRTVHTFSDAAGDRLGMDNFEGDAREGTTGYQYKFLPSPFTPANRREIEKSLRLAAGNRKALRLRKWILVTPDELLESSKKKGGGDVSWFQDLPEKLGLEFEVEHWGHRKLQALFLETPPLCLRYYPELVAGGPRRRKTFGEIRKRYDAGLLSLHRQIQFVGMPVYKPETGRGVPMEDIYIPLTVVPEGADETNEETHVDPLAFLEPGAQTVILGDPGSGKSTLLKFLAMSGISKPLQKRYRAKAHSRLPLLVPLRRYADELGQRPYLSLVDYIRENVRGDFGLTDRDLEFLEYCLETGEAVLLFDGLDELSSPGFKQTVRDRIQVLTATYPGNTVIVTSRIIGYDHPFRFDEKAFRHHRLTRLTLPQIEQFVADWYRVRVESQRERDENVRDLVRILRDEARAAIRELAENPLLLTIIALVHRIEAQLPEQRVVLYQKCTETLLTTWHGWKFRRDEARNTGMEERRNRRRMEVIAHWMQTRAVAGEKTQRAVVPYADLHRFLADHIEAAEKPNHPSMEPADLAAEFLKFIKERAGLLVEVGDGHYSFVHFTFQEYLTATHLIADNEPRGVEGYWEAIEKHCENPLWHEVVRLMVADLKSEVTKGILLDRMLDRTADDRRPQQSLLLGGILLDGVGPAEDRVGEIVGRLVDHCISSREAAEHQRLAQEILGQNKPAGEKARRAVFERSSGILRQATDPAEAIRASLWMRRARPDVGILIEAFEGATGEMEKGHLALLLGETGDAKAIEVLKPHTRKGTPGHVRYLSALALDLLGSKGREAFEDLLMVRVEAGEFTMGSDQDNDNPKRKIRTNAFLMDRFPLTNRQYKRFVEARGYQERKYWSDEGWKWKEERKLSEPSYQGDPRFNVLSAPVVGISYYEAEAYAKWAGKRLPTEQEWERAARGDKDAREYPWGDRFDGNRCNTAEAGLGQPTPVGSYPGGVSPYSCYDMAGNVWEWTASEYEVSGEDRDRWIKLFDVPEWLRDAPFRVIRGGSWYSPRDFARCAYRDWSPPDYRNVLAGVRFSRTP